MSEDGAIYRSAKIRKILELLGSIKRHEGGVQKTIIFSQFVKMIDLISHVFKEMGIAHVRCETPIRTSHYSLTRKLVIQTTEVCDLMIEKKH